MSSMCFNTHFPTLPEIVLTQSMESVTIKTWRNGAVGGARQTVNLFSKGQQVRIPLPPPNISRDSEAVKQQSHKLQSLVRFQVPQPNWRCKKPIRGLTSLQINQYCLQIQSLNLDWWRSWLAHMPVTHGVAGSSPVQSAKYSQLAQWQSIVLIRRGSMDRSHHWLPSLGC